MSAIVRFPPRRAACVWLAREGPAWVVLAHSHGWLHGDYIGALADARWLARNLGVAIRTSTTNKQEIDMAYDSLRGALFKNEDKTKPSDRDYSGELNIEGTLYWVSGWVRTSKKGTKYLGLSLKPKDDQFGASKNATHDFNDEIGF